MKNIKFVAVALLALLLLPALSLQAGKIDNLKYPKLNQIEIPEPNKVVLDNGMALYLLEDHTLPRVTLSVRLNRCGSYLEPGNLAGLAGITGEVMRTGGTENMTGDEIDAALEAIGAMVETGIDRTDGSAYANSLSEYKEDIVRILADVLRRPVFDEDKIELAKTGARSEISRRNDEPIPIAVREFRKIIYGPDSPYARQTEYATVDAVTRSDIVMFHKMAVHPENIQIAIWGDFDSQEMIALIKKYFGDWPQSGMEMPAPPDVAYTPKASVNYAEKNDINQATVLMGHIGGRMGDPDYAATIVMNNILGEGFGSRLFRNVRTKQGLAYAAGGSYSFNYDYPGYFINYTITKFGTVAQAIRAMEEQINSMQTIEPTEDEMILAKNGWLNSFVFNFDTKSEILGRMMTYDYYGMPRDYLQQLKEQVENLKPQDIIDVAKRKLDPKHLQIVVVGKADEFDEPLSTFGTVTDIDITIPGPTVEAFAATEEEMAQGKEWLTKAATVCGGADNFKKINSITVSANVTLNMPQGSMTLAIESIEDLAQFRSYQLVSTPMGDQKTVFNGTEGWNVAGGQTAMMGADEIDNQMQGFDRNLNRIFAHVDDPYYKVAYKGDEEFDGNATARLDFLTDSGFQFTIFINKESGFPAGMKYMGQTMMGPGENVEHIKEFMKIDDVMQPKLTDRETGGMTINVEATSLSLNANIDESLFVKPEGI